MALSPPFCVSNCWRTSGGNAIFSLLVLDFEPSVMSRWLATVATLLASHINTAVMPGFFSNWRKTNLKSFITQRLHRIGARGATCGKPAGEQRDDAEQNRNRDKRSRIGRADVKEQASHQTSERQRGDQTRDHSHGDEYHSLA